MQPLHFDALTIAADVANPLLGPEGATRVYGPQKGLRGPDLPKAEACLGRLAQVMRELSGEALADEPSAGAAGGLGFGLRAFGGGIFRSGSEIFAALSQLERRIQAADLVITGEGALDAQTLRGKGVGFVAEAAARADKPCYCLAGSVSVSPEDLPWKNFRAFAIVPDLADLTEATERAEPCLSRLAAHAAHALADK
jgi:glycerate kinase